MKKVIILGAAGRDFHNFNVYFRDNEQYRVVAFTATQIPFITDRVYPKELAGKLYPNGIPIYDEGMLEALIKEYDVDEIVFAYSDISYEHVMHLASRSVASGASFRLLGLKDTQLTSNKPVIAVTANRTGAGKSSLARVIARVIRESRLRLAVIRHPMPYLTFEPIQHFNDVSDLDRYQLSIEEEEEYILHLKDGNSLYAGVDYALILKEAEKYSDIILWDGGNNDFPFIKPDLNIMVVDPLRADDIVRYYPSEVNLRLADVIVINKVNLVDEESTARCIKMCRDINDKAGIFRVGLFARVDSDMIKGKRVAIVADSPSITHGELKYNIALDLARELDCKIVDAREYAKGSIRAMCERYDTKGMLPAAGYSKQQLIDLEQSINAIDCDAIILATPADLSRRLRIDKPIAKMELYINSYDYEMLITYLRDRLKKLYTL